MQARYESPIAQRALSSIPWIVYLSFFLPECGSALEYYELYNGREKSPRTLP